MIDFHCHVDLYPDPAKVVEDVTRSGMYVLSVTTTPSAWPGTFALSSGAGRIRTAIGLHPQIAHEREHELPLFDEVLPKTQYVGEVGLDGGEEYKAGWQSQIRVFSHILKACSDVGGRTLSIHSRRATTAVLDLIERFPDCGLPILHWFSGTMKELDRAKSLGCWFSVGPTMLATKKGAVIAARLQPETTLTETDGPFAKYDNRTLWPQDVRIAETQLSHIWRLQEVEVQQQLKENLRSLVTKISPRQ